MENTHIHNFKKLTIKLEELLNNIIVDIEKKTAQNQALQHSIRRYKSLISIKKGGKSRRRSRNNKRKSKKRV